MKKAGIIRKKFHFDLNKIDLKNRKDELLEYIRNIYKLFISEKEFIYIDECSIEINYQNQYGYFKRGKTLIKRKKKDK